MPLDPLQDKKTYIDECISDLNLKFECSSKTYMNPRGGECTKIDYFLYNIPCSLVVSTKDVLSDMWMNTSDHYPVKMELLSCVEKLPVKDEQTVSSRINWNRVNTV